MGSHRLIVALVIIALECQLQTYAGVFDPPSVSGKIDYMGERFVVSRTPAFKSYKSHLFAGDLLLKEINPQKKRVHGDLPLDLTFLRKKILVRVDQNKPEVEIKEINSLNDLQGFVQINSDSDALESVRFGSSFIGPNFKGHRLAEVFCAADGATDLDIYQGTVSECARFGFQDPMVAEMETNGQFSICFTSPGNQQNTKTMKIALEALPAHLAKGARLGSCGTNQKGNQKQPPPNQNRPSTLRTFIIVRTAYSYRAPGEFVRVTEEVQSDGQWRIVDMVKLAGRTRETIKFLGFRPRK